MTLIVASSSAVAPPVILDHQPHRVRLSLLVDMADPDPISSGAVPEVPAVCRDDSIWIA